MPNALRPDRAGGTMLARIIGHLRVELEATVALLLTVITLVATAVVLVRSGL
jgi:hypothetical protein